MHKDFNFDKDFYKIFNLYLMFHDQVINRKSLNDFVPKNADVCIFSGSSTIYQATEIRSYIYFNATFNFGKQITAIRLNALSMMSIESSFQSCCNRFLSSFGQFFFVVLTQNPASYSKIQLKG